MVKIKDVVEIVKASLNSYGLDSLVYINIDNEPESGVFRLTLRYKKQDGGELVLRKRILNNFYMEAELIEHIINSYVDLFAKEVAHYELTQQ